MSSVPLSVPSVFIDLGLHKVDGSVEFKPLQLLTEALRKTAWVVSEYSIMHSMFVRRK